MRIPECGRCDGALVAARSQDTLFNDDDDDYSYCDDDDDDYCYCDIDDGNDGFVMIILAMVMMLMIFDLDIGIVKI